MISELPYFKIHWKQDHKVPSVIILGFLPDFSLDKNFSLLKSQSPSAIMDKQQISTL